jgi:hypothetical protein
MNGGLLLPDNVQMLGLLLLLLQVLADEPKVQLRRLLPTRWMKDSTTKQVVGLSHPATDCSCCGGLLWRSVMTDGAERDNYGFV